MKNSPWALRRLLGRGWLLLGLATSVTACKVTPPPTVIEVDADNATVWTSNNDGATILARLARGTRLKTRVVTQGVEPSFWLVKTEQGEGIIYAKDVHVVPP